MDYGDLPAIKRMLASAGTTWDAGTEARLGELNTALSRTFEDVVGRTFGQPGADRTVLLYGRGFDQLVLGSPIRTVTAITVGGSVAGGVMTGGQVLDVSAWTPCIEDYQGQIYALTRLSGIWAAGEPVTITGQWAMDDADLTVPANVVTALNVLVAETYKTQNVPIVTDDGIVVPRRDPWADPLVRRVIEQYQISTRELVV